MIIIINLQNKQQSFFNKVLSIMNNIKIVSFKRIQNNNQNKPQLKNILKNDTISINVLIFDDKQSGKFNGIQNLLIKSYSKDVMVTKCCQTQAFSYVLQKLLNQSSLPLFCLIYKSLEKELQQSLSKLYQKQQKNKKLSQIYLILLVDSLQQSNAQAFYMSPIKLISSSMKKIEQYVLQKINKKNLQNEYQSQSSLNSEDQLLYEEKLHMVDGKIHFQVNKKEKVQKVDVFVKDGPGVGTYNLNQQQNTKTAFGKFHRTPKDIDPKLWSPDRTKHL